MATTERSELKDITERPAVIIALTVVIIIILAILADKNLQIFHIRAENKPVTDSSTMKLPDLGVSIPLSDSLKGITSSTSSLGGQTSVVKLTTSGYTSLANQCLGLKAGTEENFATLYKSQVTAGLEPAQKPLKQFDTFYIGNLGPTNAITSCRDQEIQKKFLSLSSSLDDGLAKAFASAQKL